MQYAPPIGGGRCLPYPTQGMPDRITFEVLLDDGGEHQHPASVRALGFLIENPTDPDYEVLAIDGGEVDMDVVQER